MIQALLIGQIVLWGVVAVQFAAIFALYNHLGNVALNSREGRDQQGPPEASVMIRNEAANVRGQPILLPVSGRPNLILFTSITCEPCEKLRPDLNEFVVDRADVHTVVVCFGSVDEVRRWSGSVSDLIEVIPDPKNSIAQRYGITITPFCLVTDESGVVRGKGVVNDRSGLDLAANRSIEVSLPEMMSKEPRHD